MNFKYAIEKESGVKIDHWEIAEININPITGKSSAKLLGYLSEEMKISGKSFEMEHHVYFDADKEDSKFSSLVTALTQVIKQKLKDDREPKEEKDERR